MSDFSTISATISAILHAAMGAYHVRILMELSSLLLCVCAHTLLRLHNFLESISMGIESKFYGILNER